MRPREPRPAARCLPASARRRGPGFRPGPAALPRRTPRGRNGEEQKLNFYNWDTYTGKTTLADFRAATGMAVKMSLFATNDELFAKLKAGNPGFDVIVPSNEYVTRLRIADLIQPLDHGQDSQPGEHLAGVPESAVRSRPALLDALHLAGARASAIASRRSSAFPTAGSG